LTDSGTGYDNGIDNRVYHRPVRTEAQRKEDERIQREHLEELARERKRADEAEARAEKLLLESLNAKQTEEYKKDKSFVVHSRSGMRYRIRHGRVANVDVVCKEGKILHKLCAHPAEYVPNPDTMLAQKLFLEHQEEEFLKVANVHKNYGVHEPVLERLQ
jgi:hypothetical protein